MVHTQDAPSYICSLHVPSMSPLLTSYPVCRPCLRPALRGCLALASIGAATGGKLQLSEEDAAEVATSLLDVNVRGLVVADRQLCLALLTALYQVRYAH